MESKEKAKNGQTSTLGRRFGPKCWPLSILFLVSDQARRSVCRSSSSLTIMISRLNGGCTPSHEDSSSSVTRDWGVSAHLIPQYQNMDLRYLFPCRKTGELIVISICKSLSSHLYFTSDIPVNCHLSSIFYSLASHNI